MVTDDGIHSMNRLYSRRTVVAAIGGLAWCACRRDHGSHGGDRAEEEAARSPAPGGELLFAFDGAAIAQFVLDPHKSAFAPHHRIMRSIFDSLITALPDHRFGPWLARSWDVTPDGAQYTFHLRDDVKFHDGTRFDAHAVKTNLDRVADPKNALFAQTDLGPYLATDIVDDFTVRVRFASGYAPLLANLSKSSLGIMSPEALRLHGDQVHAHPTGTGPFRFRSLESGTEVALDRNSEYRWPPSGARNPGPAWLERLTFRNVPEEATRVAVLQSGQSGAADLIPPQNLLTLRQSADYRVIEGELLNHNYSLFLNVKRDPWTDSRMREAFRLSLDLDAAVKTVYLGTLARAWSPLSPSILGYDKSLENSWKQDPQSARRTLDSLGWKLDVDGVRVKDGKRLSVTMIDAQGNREKRLDLLTLLRHQLRETGFEVRIDSEPSGTYLAKVAGGDYDLIAASQFASDPDVLRRLYTRALRAQFSAAKVDDPEIDRVLDEAYQSPDRDTRVRLYGEAQRRIVEQTYSIPAYVLIYNVVSSRRVGGIAIDTHGFPTFHDAWVAS
jgi:peptide/nickel transport system substrate-binding protein